MLALLIFIFMMKSQLNDYLSSEMKKQQSSIEIKSVDMLVDSRFNYSKQTNTAYRFTFLEFGATGCSACIKMEKVMDEIRHENGDSINVVFYNILKSENQALMKYYGISVIPTQVLLDENAKEFYRHTGYISSEDLIRKFKK